MKEIKQVLVDYAVSQLKSMIMEYVQISAVKIDPLKMKECVDVQKALLNGAMVFAAILL